MRYHSIPMVMAAALVLASVGVPQTRATTYSFSVSSLMVPIDGSNTGLNNAVPLADSAGNVTVSASGGATFGGLSGETYTSAVVQYRDSADDIQYVIIPMGGSTGISSASHVDFGFLADTDRSDDTGTVNISELNQSSTQIAAGTINGASQTNAQTGIAVSGDDTVSTDIGGLTTISVTGPLDYAPGLSYGSVIVQYRTSGTGPFYYDSLPIGGTRTYGGVFIMRLMVTDASSLASSASGTLTVTDTQVIPEPASLSLIAIGCFGLCRRWRRINSK